MTGSRRWWPSWLGDVGTVENTTDKALSKVRVKVHLSNGTELGPTPEGDLAPGAKRDVLVDAGE